MKVLILLLIPFNFFAQHLFYQEVVQGGVCIAGVSTADISGIINLPVHIAPGSSIKKIFLISYTVLGTEYMVNDFTFNIDGIPITLSSDLDQSLFVESLLGTNFYSGHRTHIKDITTLLPSVGTSITIDWSQPQAPPINCPSCRYAAPVVVIIYESPSLPTTNISLTINNLPNSQIISQNYYGLNPVSNNCDISFGIHADRLAGNSNDGYHFKLNGTDIGSSFLPENTIFGTGQVGTFYYENGINTAQNNDIADAFFTGADGVMNLNNYVNQQLFPLNLEIEYLDFPNVPHNYLIGSNFAYSTPCEPQNVFVSNDTTICPGETVQLLATGGVNYEWLPTTGLSCSTCANPIFSGDTSQLYTVRIWGNDSCSVVRPVMMHVRKKAATSSVVSAPSSCGAATGSIQLSLVENNVGTSFSIDHGAAQSTGNFLSVAAGTHLITIQDSEGCAYDTLVTVAAYNPVNAAFTATPTSGASPLQVQFTNQSNNATDVVWSVDGMVQSNPFHACTLTDTGTFVVQLIAYQNDPSCADTAWATIVVYDSLLLHVPNVFTPNNDGVNDFFGITTNANLQLSGYVVNRWGETVASWSQHQVPNGTTTLWNGSIGNDAASEGVYFYHLSWETETGKGKLDGQLTLIK
jgi:gliding motility-associated-like protein